MSVSKRPSGKYLARWRETPGGPQRSKQFDRKVDAERFLVKLRHEQQAGTYVDPRIAMTPLGEYAAEYLARMRPSVRASTWASVERTVRLRIVPLLGHRALGSLKRRDVEAWVAGLGVAPGTAATCRQHLGQILNAAVEDGLIPRNPAVGARMPRIEEQRAQPVPVEVLDAILEGSPPWFGVAVILGAGVGLRRGEATGLTVDRIDFLRRVVRVDRQLVSDEGAPSFAPLKTSSSYRTVPLATFAADALAEHLATHGPGRDGLVLHLRNGGPLSGSRFSREWRLACARAGAGAGEVRFHDLRHTFASMLLSSGVSVKAVADWLGHASPTITLETYAHLMPVDEDRARVALDRAFARVDPSPTAHIESR